ncbi:hypothetical protein [Pseudomonas asplenii]|uniref:hypothetical protein n=1 Tax=Pseudomonas asplenii TaxID=53407 RepID=UPI00036BB1D6|nr:hypothetical protein [Pseudomonas fuscovaginae]
MIPEQAVEVSNTFVSLPTWHELLADHAALLARSGTHHKALIKGAHELHQARIVDRDGLCDLLEQADGALAYAIEELLDQPGT